MKLWQGILFGLLTALGVVLWVLARLFHTEIVDLEEVQDDAREKARKKLDSMSDPDVVDTAPDPDRIRSAGGAGSTVGRNIFYDRARHVLRGFAGKGRSMGTDPGSRPGDRDGGR